MNELASEPEADVIARAAEAMMTLAAERPWKEVSLRGIAEQAGLPLARLFEAAPSRLALLAEVSARLDRAALSANTPLDSDVHDRLFEAVMGRIEAMEPHRAVLTSIAAAVGTVPLLPHLPHTARALLEAAGVPSTPVRVVVMTAVWARIVRVWAADSGALNRTMAEADRRLKDGRSVLGRLGAGF